MEKGAKGCLGGLLLVVSLGLGVSVLASMFGSPEKAPQLSLQQPVFVKSNATICNIIELYSPGAINRCGRIGAQQVVVLQTAEGRELVKIAPMGMSGDNAEGFGGWVHKSDLHN